ncbi:MAG: hypothetical protein HDS33_07765 [Bacteroides sp.]|nr:hypothetical protein [Bacteroides sp.]
MKKIIALAAVALSLSASAAPISPTPKVQTSGTATAFTTADATFRLSAGSDADSDALRLLSEKLPISADGAIEIVIGGKESSISDKIPAEADGYYLSVSNNNVTIGGADGPGQFYGVQSFLQLFDAPSVTETEVIDTPEIPIRGIIEGFYGNPWSHDERIAMFEFMGRHKMNEYTYGPKNDPYHRGQWATPYPAAEGKLISELAEAAHRNKVKFVWAMHPGNSIAESNYAAAVSKFESMYELGVRNFSLFFDDISGENVAQQVAYLKHLTDNFVKKHSDVSALSVCPTAYNTAFGGAGLYNYMSTMAQLDSDVKIMWTGRSVVDMLEVGNLQSFTEMAGRKPYIWLNYPVNDYGGGSILMGSVTGLDPAIKNHVSAFCSNPMEYAEASKVALFSLADFAWNPDAFNPSEAWEQSIEELMPDAAEAFRTFCLSHVDYYSSSHGYRRADETPEFQALNTECGDLSAENAAKYREYFQKQLSAAQTLEALNSTMTAELSAWILNFRLQAERGLALTNIAEILVSDSPADFIDEYKKYEEATAQAAAIVDRDFSGTIKRFYPRSATRYVEPFLTETLGNQVNAFKDLNVDYPADLFPQQLLADGEYYIKYNNKFLCNGTGAANNSPSNPSWRTQEDDINPNRQIWKVRIDVNTGRYSIISLHDGRYINEIGNFGVNPYSADWNTYTITRLNGKYALQCGGNAGTKFLEANSSRINRGDRADYNVKNFIFEFIPVNDEPEPTTEVTLPATVMILNDSGKALTKVGSQAKFTELSGEPKKTQQFTIEADKTSNRFAISCVSLGAPLDEKATFRTKAEFSADWHTYIILEHNGKHSIQNCVHVNNNNNTNYWIATSDDLLSTSDSIDPFAAYQFTLRPVEESSISEIESSANSQTIYDLQGRRVVNPTKGLYIINGKVTRK